MIDWDDIEEGDDTIYDYDMCRCAYCGWEGKVADCESGEESEGWEYPVYTIHYCPVCEDGGCIDDYWSSEEDENINEEDENI